MFCGLKHLGVYCGVVRNISWPSPNRDQIRHFSTLRMRHFWTWAFRGKPASSWPGEGFRHPDKTAVFIGLCPLCTWRWSWSLMIFDDLWWSLMIFDDLWWPLSPVFNPKIRLIFGFLSQDRVLPSSLDFSHGPEGSRIDHSSISESFFTFFCLLIATDGTLWNIHFFQSFPWESRNPSKTFIFWDLQTYGPIDDIFEDSTFPI